MRNSMVKRMSGTGQAGRGVGAAVGAAVLVAACSSGEQQ